VATHISSIKFFFEKPWRACLAASFLFLIVAATGEVIFTGMKTNADFKWIFVAMSALCIVLAVLAYWRESGSNEQPVASNAKPKINPKTYNVVISKPEFGKKLKPPVILTGKMSRKLPQGVQLWLFSEGGIPKSKKHYPNREATIDPNREREWSIKYKPGHKFEDGQSRTLQLYLVGPDGQALITAYKNINAKFVNLEKDEYEPLLALTEDIVPACPRHIIYLSKPDSGTVENQDDPA
jgi:hypothetical protein